MTWHLGQRVVCIKDVGPYIGDDRYGRFIVVTEGVTKGKIYTIRDIETHLDRIGFRFQEVRNPAMSELGETVFDSVHFRPLWETDVKERLDIKEPVAV